LEEPGVWQTLGKKKEKKEEKKKRVYTYTFIHTGGGTYKYVRWGGGLESGKL
jgi:hypothetical protein